MKPKPKKRVPLKKRLAKAWDRHMADKCGTPIDDKYFMFFAKSKESGVFKRFLKAAGVR